MLLERRFVEEAGIMNDLLVELFNEALSGNKTQRSLGDIEILLNYMKETLSEECTREYIHIYNSFRTVYNLSEELEEYKLKMNVKKF